MRKNWKKIVSLLLAASMAMSMNVATFAEEIHDEVVEEVVEVAEAEVLSGNSASDNSTSNNAVTVSSTEVKAGNYTVKISYNNAVSFTGKALKADDLAVTATISEGNISVAVKGKFEKSDAAKGKGIGAAKYVVTGVKAVKGASKDQKKVVKEVAKALKKAGNKLDVTVKALSLSKNGVVSANIAKAKEAKAKFELKNGTVSPNYLVSLAKYNEKKPEKSKVVVYYAQVKKTNKGEKLVVKSSTLKNGKNGVNITAKDGVVTLTGSVEGTLKK